MIYTSNEGCCHSGSLWGKKHPLNQNEASPANEGQWRGLLDLLELREKGLVKNSLFASQIIHVQLSNISS